MILNNKNINTEKQFRDNFNFKEVWGKLDIVLVDLENISFTNKEKKEKYLEVMKRCMKLEQNDILTKEEVKDLKNSMEELYVSIYSITNWSDVKKENTFLIICLLHQLANLNTYDIQEIINCIHTNNDFNYDLNKDPDDEPDDNLDDKPDDNPDDGPVDKLEENSDKNPNDKPEKQSDKSKNKLSHEQTDRLTDRQADDADEPIVKHNNSTSKYLYKQLSDPSVTVIQLLNSDTPYEIPCYDFSSVGAMNIISKKLINRSDSKYGDVTIHIIGKGKKVIRQLHLKSKEFLYINTLNGRYIQTSPNLSVSDNHIISRSLTPDGRNTLKNYSFINGTGFLYESKELENIKHFTADDENGFLGIIDKYIALYTNFNFEELFDEMDDFVWICLDGSQYIILNNLGNLKTNFALVLGWYDLISIYFHKNLVYGIKKDGSVISSRPSGGTKNWKEIIYLSIYNDYVLGMNRAGEYFSEGFEINQGLSGQVILSKKGYVVLNENKLWLYYYNNKKPPYSLYSGIKEFAINDFGIVMTDMSNNLLFYDFENGQVTKLL
jgi:hypothetical protein